MKNTINDWIGRISGKKKNVRLILALGLAGMLLILVSEIAAPAEKQTCREMTSEDPYEDYIAYTEKRLADILGKIDGVGRVSVMVTAQGTQENIYEQEVKESSSGEKGSRQSENSVVIVQNDGNREALVRKTVNPELNGVIVVCEGGNSSRIKEKICCAVSVSLGIETSRIYVAGYRE